MTTGLTKTTVRGALAALLMAAGALLLLATGRAATAATFNVDVAPGRMFTFSPAVVSIQPGDTVTWTWRASGHSVTSGDPGAYSGLFDSGVRNGGSFSFTFPHPGMFDYFCQPHGACCGMVGQVKVAGTTPPPSQLVNISTRMRVQTGQNVLIGGFVITGSASKKVIVRAIGPSLTHAGLTGVLANPVLELHRSNGSLITSNDNWKDSQQAAIQATTIPPSNDLESAIVATIAPGAYTAILSGKNATSGVGLVEVYDLNQTAASKLVNVSSRGSVQTGDNVMIGGFILGGGTAAAKVVVRAIGPSLSLAGISGALANPTLELRNANGTLVRSNDNWKDTQQAEIQATGVPPKNALESAIVATLSPGGYTAIVAGKSGGTGVGLVEVYRLQ